jgi:biopolymer transport protein ExbD
VPIRSRAEDAGVAIDMTPIIDMVFMLLTFFLLATTFQRAEREMQIALPFASSSAPISAALREIVVNVTTDGRAIISGRTVTDDELRSLVGGAAKNNPDQKITVRGDRGAQYCAVVRVLDICKACGIQQPYLDTELSQ